MGVSFATYERLSLEDPHGKWELVCGRLRKKPDITQAHNWAIWILAADLASQIDLRSYVVDTGQARVGISTGSYVLPDLCVIPRSLRPSASERRNPHLYVIQAPLPLIVETWSLSTVDYDAGTKFKEYQLRGDPEIWLLHAYDCTLTAWWRQRDGSYSQTVYTEDTIAPIGLPGVVIDVTALFQ